MSYQKERDFFIARMSQEGMPLHVARRVLSLAATIDRLAVAKCNGDFPAEHPDKWPSVECPECGSAWHASAFARRKPSEIKALKASGQPFAERICIDCRTEKALIALMPDGFRVKTGGDPRGYTTMIAVPSGATAYAGADGFGVPVRS